MKIALRVLGIILVVLGLLVLIVSPPAGVAGIILGVLCIIRSNQKLTDKITAYLKKSREKTDQKYNILKGKIADHEQRLKNISPQIDQVKFSENVLPGLTKQFDETVHIIETTVNPDVFFSRYDFLLKTIARIIENKKAMGVNDIKSIELLEQLEKPQNKEDQINDFINRSYERLLIDMSNLKTENGKTNKAKKYFDEMNEYKDKMYNSNLVLLDNLKQQAN